MPLIETKDSIQPLLRERKEINKQKVIKNAEHPSGADMTPLISAPDYFFIHFTFFFGSSFSSSEDAAILAKTQTILLL